MEGSDKEYIFRWGLPLKDLYNVAIKFYKEKEGSAIQFSYEEKLHLIAYTKQVAHGQYDESTLPAVGVLDVIGRDRRLAWQALGDMSARDAMAGFINLIDKRCLHFNAFIQAQKAKIDDEKRKLEEKKKKEIEKEMLQVETFSNNEKTKFKEETTRRLIQDALNEQTFTQFKSYAEQQFPGNPEQQAVLVRQLQNQHYHQYMLQLQQQQHLQSIADCNVNNNNNNNNNNDDKSQHQHHHLHHNNNFNGNLSVTNEASDFKQMNKVLLEGEDAHTIMNPESVSHIINDGHTDSEDSENDTTLVQSASMWTRKDLQNFKNRVRKEGADTIMKVGHGETITVRVPTHEGGSCLFWEFATDNYDIGFGVYFEWEKSISKVVSVHISESEDEDSDELIEDEQDEQDIERARSTPQGSSRPSPTNKPPVSVVVPVYRRDCHEEVYAGSHPYPGEGVYLLKFDNSYSLWRSKTLYYRIYYTR